MTVHHHNQASEMPSTMTELLSLIEHEIPEGRQSLQDSHSNLDKVADYCESNYFQSDNKRAALEETKNYTTQSLASVAYQVNTLAYNLLHMLDLQTAQLAEMESQINHISETVSIHKEKVARREIGILTNNKTTCRQHKILVPANPERPIKYTRKPIDYAVLDDIGHGVKISVPANPRAKRTPSQISKNGSTMMMTSNVHMSSSGVAGPAPTNKPPTPPQSVRSMGSLSRGNKEYRTIAPPIAPPQVPSNYAPNYPIGHPKAHDKRGSGYSTLPLSLAHQGGVVANAMQQHMHQQTLQRQSQSHYQQSAQSQQGPPQVGMVHPMTHAVNAPHMNAATNNFLPPSPTPPPPPPPLSHHHDAMSPISDSLPEPPMHVQQHTISGHHVNDNYERHNANASPPLPPPPSDDGVGVPTSGAMNMFNHSEQHYRSNASGNNGIGSGAAGYRRKQHSKDPDWVPDNYIEKVIAIYDYAADKDDELSFSENSVIYVIRKNDDGWYEGVMEVDGVMVTGLFPGNYVEGCM